MAQLRKMPRKSIAIAALITWLVAVGISILNPFVGFVFLQAAVGVAIASIILE